MKNNENNKQNNENIEKNNGFHWFLLKIYENH